MQSQLKLTVYKINFSGEYNISEKVVYNYES
jgi:hypothetical protein